MSADPGRRALLTAIGSLAGAAILPGCAAFDYRALDAPRALARLDRAYPAPRVAVVLGSGGPRGYAHLGVLRVLDEAGVAPDVMVGSSVGALLAVLWASGLTAVELDALSWTGGPLTVFDPSPFADRGWIHGRKLQDFVNARVSDSPLETLPRRAVVVATRREDKVPHFFMKGNAGVAVRASCAMPGIISPVGIEGVEYEDADESLPLAVGAARSLGALCVIAVDVSARPGTTPPDASPSQRERDLRRRARIEPEVRMADVLVHPELRYRASPRREYFAHARAMGEAAARTQLAEILDVVRARVG